MDESAGYEYQEWLAVIPAEIDRRFFHSTDEVFIRQWSLVLTARFVPCRIEHLQNGWQLLIPAELMAMALEELRLYEKENSNWPPLLQPFRTHSENRLSTLSVLLLLATFHNITLLNIRLFGHTPLDWHYLGSAKVHLIHYREWWRPITALTLHADWVHLASNLTIGGFFILLLCRELGSGLAWALLLSAGTMGNLANAYFQLPTHSSIGSSTAVFAADLTGVADGN
jgi:rhomboid protease GluP